MERVILFYFIDFYSIYIIGEIPLKRLYFYFPHMYKQ